MHRKKGHTIHTNLTTNRANVFRRQTMRGRSPTHTQRCSSSEPTPPNSFSGHTPRQSAPYPHYELVSFHKYNLLHHILAYRWQKATEARWKQRSSRSLLSRPTSKVNRREHVESIRRVRPGGPLGLPWREKREKTPDARDARKTERKPLTHTHPSNPTEQHLITRQYTRHERGRGRSKHVVALHQSERAEGRRVKPAGHVKALG